MFEALLRQCIPTPNQLQTNGQIERFKKTLVARLRHYAEEHQSDRAELLQLLTYAHNLRLYLSKGTTPFYFVVSRRPPGIIVQQGPINQRAAGTQSTAHVKNDILQKLTEFLQVAPARKRKAQERYKKYYDQNSESYN